MIYHSPTTLQALTRYCHTTLNYSFNDETFVAKMCFCHKCTFLMTKCLCEETHFRHIMYLLVINIRVSSPNIFL